VIRAVTFDAAGTLLAPREPVGETYASTAARFGIPADAAAVEARFRAAFRAAPPLAFPGAPPDDVPRLERAWWRAVVRAAFGPAADHPRFDDCFDVVFAHYARADAWAVFPDVPDALAGLHARGLRLGVLSNFDGRLPGLLDALGIAPLVDAVLWSSAIGAAKPSRAAFETAAHRLGVPVSALCHVGDDPEADVAGARAAGATAVHVYRGVWSLADAVRRIAPG
jgi:putative hydrolase of the HAD superfamily